MSYRIESLEKLIDMFHKLPSIGQKSAQRLAYYILHQDKEYIKTLTDTIFTLKDKIKECPICCNYTETIPCPICASEKRDKSVICVVSELNDLSAIERTNDYKGVYHVLHGIISPLEGKTIDKLRIQELIHRLENSKVNEVILAINPSMDGELTMQYLARIVRQYGIKVTRIASGIPIGADIELADEATLARALNYRVEIE
ncbi:MAG: recombination protein RecR [Bacteroidetes bacterium]|nr:recombination protein RecR [Bacteroidota bacterium]